MIRLNATAPHRFWAKVSVPNEDGCMLWTGAIMPNGYGYFAATMHAPAKMQYAHRVAYQMAYGEIPEGMVIDHLCKVRHCVAPLHLEAVTQGVNVRRGDGPGLLTARNAARTHCKRGHEFTPENTYTQRRPAGRGCRTCKKEQR